ncbi:conserved virulence factor C family protein [Paenibacillus sp. CGMCC 1.16610]|uniref:Virulence factor n=1 Tax=Paenibacillus anseongense TaxID=2682845 RepID=A0ABW9U278_9BACL|nr:MULTISPECIES: virulence factor [Paenibacillus]MBA2943052.1 conserved virulence factor C family protein [Paenibacillus sp. CGMCC 1.16610]MVQ33548.1 virulence factor [Paenibacillus anseongense]
MKIISIEPTPSPNSMKLNMDESLPAGVRKTYTKKNCAEAPDNVQQLLAVQGVISLFHAADFIALDRTSKGDWQFILAKAREILGVAEGSASSNDLPVEQTQAEAAFGEAQVLVQMFRGIPLQVRVRAGNEEARVAMPERFTQAAVRAGTASPNLIKERKLEELGVRYGELKDIAGEVVQELDASYDDARVEALVSSAMLETDVPPSSEASEEDQTGATLEQLRHSDWKLRYAALQKIQPSLETLPLLVHALQDENTSIRRLATVYLGDIKEPEVLPFLYRALEDDTPSVRRTAGDTLSDLGDPAAMPAMAKALKDRNKLVRWRAARFLYEVGDNSVLKDLQEAADDPEFEVRMQVKIALERIEGGHAAEGSVWQQMTRRNEQ